LVVGLLGSELRDGYKRASHGVLAEGSRLSLMARDALAIADVLDIRMNIAEGTVVAQARIRYGLSRGIRRLLRSSRRGLRIPPCGREHDEDQSAPEDRDL